MKRAHYTSLLAAAVATLALSGCEASEGQFVYQSPPASMYEAPAAAYVPASYREGAYVPKGGVTVLDGYQIDQLTGPVALFPDPLLAALLPACTYPDEIGAAAQWLQSHPNPTQAMIDAQPWDASVKALVHYPAVLQQLAGNLQWTAALGAAFVNQQQGVMDSIQRLRAEASLEGNLNSNAYQYVAVDEGCMEILPVTPGYICVPVYNPFLVYAEPCDFGFDEFGLGGFSTFCFDWHDHRIGRGFDWGHFDRRRFEEGGLHEWSGSQAWVRDNRRPAPVMPPRFAHEGNGTAPFLERGVGPLGSAGTLGYRGQAHFSAAVRPEYHPQAGGSAAGASPRYEFNSPAYRNSYVPGRTYTAPEPLLERPQFSSPHYSAPQYSSPHVSSPHYSSPHFSSPHFQSSGGGGHFGGGGRRR